MNSPKYKAKNDLFMQRNKLYTLLKIGHKPEKKVRIFSYDDNMHTKQTSKACGMGWDAPT